jgi:hypothetical protein
MRWKFDTLNLENSVPDQGNSVQDKYQRFHPLFLKKNSEHSKAKKGKKREK